MFITLKLRKLLLIGEQKFGHYLLYAVGEIVLVVAGILIALELDYWDKQNHYASLEKQYYQTMKAELLQDKKLLLQELDYSNQYLSRFKHAKQLITDNDRSQMDLLAVFVSELKYFSDFRQSSSVYQTLVSSGEIKHIKSKSIIAAFQNLERDYVFIERLEDVHKQVVLQDIITTVVDFVQFDPLEVKKPDALYSYQFNNVLYLLIGLIMEKHGVYQVAIDDIDKLVASIESELSSSEAH